MLLKHLFHLACITLQNGLVVRASQHPEPTPESLILSSFQEQSNVATTARSFDKSKAFHSQITEAPRLPHTLHERDPQFLVGGMPQMVGGQMSQLWGLAFAQAVGQAMALNGWNGATTSHGMYGLANSMISGMRQGALSAFPSLAASFAQSYAAGHPQATSTWASNPSAVVGNSAGFAQSYAADHLQAPSTWAWGPTAVIPAKPTGGRPGVANAPFSTTKPWVPPWLQGAQAFAGSSGSWMNWSGPFGILDRFPALAVHGGGGLQKTAFCSSVSTAFTSFVLRNHISVTSGVPRPTLTIRMPPPEREDGAWLQCLPGPIGAFLGGNIPPWGPGPAPVVSLVGDPQARHPFAGHAGPTSDLDSAVCSAVIDSVAKHVSQAYSSVMHSRLDNWLIGPRAGFPTVTVHIPSQDQASTCIRTGVFSGGTIPGVWPRTTQAPTSVVVGKAPIVGVTAAAPAASVIYSTIYVTATMSSAVPSANPVNAAPPGATAPLAELSVETIPGDQVPCRPYPDQFTVDWSRVSIMSPKTQLQVNCWTVASLPGDAGTISGSNVWLHASRENCWVHDSYLGTFIPNIADQLQYCVTPQHQVGTLRSQYSRQDCYDKPSLNSPSHNLGSGRHVDVQCKLFGDVVMGNASWVKSTAGCVFPGAIFEDEWYGPPLQLCV